MQTVAAERQKSQPKSRLEQISLNLAQQILLGLMIAGAIFRLFLLGAKSIWLDEAFSIAISQRGWIDVLRMVVQSDTHPPLYYLLLKLWLVLGNGETQVRLLSAIFSIVSIVLMYLLVTELYNDRRAGLIGAAVLSFSPFHIWYAQEARMYAMLTFLILASAYFFIRALQHGAARYWVGYVMTTTLALYTDNGAVWYVVTILLFSVISYKRFLNRATGWFLSHCAIAILYIYWLPFLWEQARQVTEDFWLSPPSFQTVLETFLDFQSLNFPSIAISLLYIATIFVFAYIVPGKSWQRRFASTWLFIPLVASLLISLRQPIFLSRNLIAASLGFYLLIADTIWKFQSKKAVLALLMPLILMNLVSITYNTWIEEKEDWRRAASMVAQSAYGKKDGLLVFMPGYAELPFQYYFKQYNLELDQQGFPGDELLLHPETVQVGDIPKLLYGRPYVWLVIRDLETDDPGWQVKDWLDHNGYKRYPGFSHENATVLTYVHWDKVKTGRAPTHIQTRYKFYLPVIYHRSWEMVHIVQSGENLLEIALQYQTTVQELVDVNKLDKPNKLTPGQKLIIP